MRLYVSLRTAEFERLAELARTERRSPREQAEHLIVRALDAPEPAEQRSLVERDGDQAVESP